MVEVGVADIGIYVPPYYLSHADLAKARGCHRRNLSLDWAMRKWPLFPIGRML
jgi:3-hydroxy-3-methylglutaryl CoA synthase